MASTLIKVEIKTELRKNMKTSKLLLNSELNHIALVLF